jgi:predicted SnoaL-like aldol condensation-catalyzing enzyme
MMRSPREVVEAYNFELYNGRRFDLADALVAESMVRHEVGGTTVLTRAQARERIETLCAEVQDFNFTLLHTIVDGDYVCIVYQCDMTRHDGTPDAISSIEVFHVVDGVITEVWNNPHQHGQWSMPPAAQCSAPRHESRLP